MIKRLVKISVISAIYIILSLMLTPLTFGSIQIRVAEALIVLCYFKKDYCYSIIIGCLITNLFSPLGIYDLGFGLLHTILSVLIVANVKNIYIGTLAPSILMFIIAIEMNMVLELDMNIFIIYLYLFIGELIAVSGFGLILYTIITRNTKLKGIL